MQKITCQLPKWEKEEDELQPKTRTKMSEKTNVFTVLVCMYTYTQPNKGLNGIKNFYDF